MKWYHVEYIDLSNPNRADGTDIQLAKNLFHAYRQAILKRSRLNNLLNINHKVKKVYLSTVLNSKL